MKDKYNKSRRATYNLTVHLIFVTKYRHPCINKAMLKDMKPMADKVLEAWGGKVIEMEGEADHIHMLINYPPSKKLSNLVGNLKGSITRQLWDRYEYRLKLYYWKKRVLWTPSYFVASCGGVTVEQLKQYVQDQEQPRV